MKSNLVFALPVPSLIYFTLLQKALQELCSINTQSWLCFIPSIQLHLKMGCWDPQLKNKMVPEKLSVLKKIQPLFHFLGSSPSCVIASLMCSPTGQSQLTRTRALV